MNRKRKRSEVAAEGRTSGSGSKGKRKVISRDFSAFSNNEFLLARTIEEGMEDPDVNKDLVKTRKVRRGDLPGPRDPSFQSVFSSSLWDDFRDSHNPPRWDPVLARCPSPLSFEQHFANSETASIAERRQVAPPPPLDLPCRGFNSQGGAALAQPLLSSPLTPQTPPLHQQLEQLALASIFSDSPLTPISSSPSSPQSPLLQRMEWCKDLPSPSASSQGDLLQRGHNLFPRPLALPASSFLQPPRHKTYTASIANTLAGSAAMAGVQASVASGSSAVPLHPADSNTGSLLNTVPLLPSQLTSRSPNALQSKPAVLSARTSLPNPSHPLASLQSVTQSSPVPPPTGNPLTKMRHVHEKKLRHLAELGVKPFSFSIPLPTTTPSSPDKPEQSRIFSRPLLPRDTTPDALPQKKRFRTEEDDENRRRYRRRKKVEKQANLTRKHIRRARVVRSDAGVRDFQVSSGGWTGSRSSSDLPAPAQSLEELIDMGYDVFEFDGKSTAPIVDREDKVYGACMGPPGADSPDQAADFLQAERTVTQDFRVVRIGNPEQLSEPPDHRRGSYGSVNGGASMGGGQQRPQILKIIKALESSVYGIMSNPSTRLIMRHYAGALRTWFKQIVDFNLKMIEIITAAYPDIKDKLIYHPDDEIPFSATTLNFGPQVVTVPHRDHQNPAYGICVITALGRYNPDMGGHLVLPEARLVIRFPAGTSIAIPSAGLIHYNLPIQPGEERYSIVQYTAAGLFRWWGNGFQTAEEYRRALGLRASELREEAAARLQAGINRFSRLSDLQRSTEGEEDRSSNPSQPGPSSNSNSSERTVRPLPTNSRSVSMGKDAKGKEVR